MLPDGTVEVLTSIVNYNHILDLFLKSKQNDNLLRDGTVEGNIAIMMVVIKKLMALIRVAIKIATKETMMTMWRWETSTSLMITEEEKICVFQSFSICQHWLSLDSFSSIFKGADDTDRKADSGSKSFSEILTEQRMTNIKKLGNNLFFQNVFWVLL